MAGIPASVDAPDGLITATVGVRGGLLDLALIKRLVPPAEATGDPPGPQGTMSLAHRDKAAAEEPAVALPFTFAVPPRSAPLDRAVAPTGRAVRIARSVALKVTTGLRKGDRTRDRGL